jgi:transposase
MKQSEKDISKRLDVSVSKIDRKLTDISSHTVLRHSSLPKSMNWDEFKATKDTKGKMAFIITDNYNGNIFDIHDSRKSIDLDKYFRRYSKSERDKVKHISIDFYSGYIFLAKRLFRNADISIDRFHIVIQAYNALNTTRVKLCHKSNPNYNKLKDYWKLIVKNENELSNKKKYSKHFKKEISQKEIVQYLINTNKELKATYECYQGLINSLKDKNFCKFKSIVLHSNKNISDKMKQALKLYNNNLKYIENSFKYDINNGIIEGTNNLIKCLKRIAFGYRKYDHFIARIFLIKGIIKE